MKIDGNWRNYYIEKLQEGKVTQKKHFLGLTHKLRNYVQKKRCPAIDDLAIERYRIHLGYGVKLSILNNNSYGSRDK